MFIKLDDFTDTVIHTKNLAYFAKGEQPGADGTANNYDPTIRFVFNGGVIIDARYEDEEKRDSEFEWVQVKVNA